MDLWIGRGPTEFESAVLDSGFDGYLSQDHGVAILLGQRALKVEYLGGGNLKPDVPKAGQATPSDYQQQLRAVQANKSLPGGEMSGADWKRMMPRLMPEIDVSHLEDGEKYFKSGVVKKPVDGGGTASDSEMGIRYSPAGRGAVTADELSRDRANEMLEAGEDPKKVFYYTGWERGIDGQWRFEIDDNGAELKPEFNKLVSDWVQSNGKWKSYALSSILNHPKLFAAYPFLKRMRVFIDGTQGGRFIDWGEGDGRISVGAGEGLPTLMHEITHVIQSYEGFARGGSPESALELGEKAYKQFKKKGS
jgi:hypothetical protein